MGTTAEPFSWQRLPKHSNASVRLQNAARRFWRATFDAEQLRSHANETLGLPLEGFGPMGSQASAGPLESLGADVQLQGEGWTVQVSVEPALVAAVVGRVVGKPVRLDTGAPLPDSLRGAFVAVVQQLARLGSAEAPPAVAPKALVGPLWSTDFWVRVAGAGYRGRLGLQLNGVEVVPQLDTKSSWPVSLPIVVARVHSTVAELASLEAGDGFMFAAGSTLAEAYARGIDLCAPGCDRELHAEATDRGLVLRDARVVHYEPEMADAEQPTDPTVEQVILEAPVEVRVELGVVTRPATEWLSLSIGEIITTDIPVGGSAVLRAAGKEVARGQLVNVDGLLGVKIEQLAK